MMCDRICSLKGFIELSCSDKTISAPYIKYAILNKEGVWEQLKHMCFEVGSKAKGEASAQWRRSDDVVVMIKLTVWRLVTHKNNPRSESPRNFEWFFLLALFFPLNFQNLWFVSNGQGGPLLFFWALNEILLYVGLCNKTYYATYISGRRATYTCRAVCTCILKWISAGRAVCFTLCEDRLLYENVICPKCSC